MKIGDMVRINEFALSEECDEYQANLDMTEDGGYIYFLTRGVNGGAWYARSLATGLEYVRGMDGARFYWREDEIEKVGASECD